MDNLTFILTVDKMREAQRTYFKSIAQAKKTKLPGDFAAADKALKESKALEAQVDAALPEILQLEMTK